MLDHQVIINQTQKWLSTVVIAHRFCPFAKREFDGGNIHFAIIESEDLETQLEHLIKCFTALDRDPGRETSLLIFPRGLSDFEAYLDLLDLGTALIKNQGYEGVYQLASFHPQYRFTETEENDPCNYTNRSPYPMLHILREASIEAALKSYPNPETIPTRNIKLARELGLETLEALLDACYN